jgi:hypothetical protein
MATNLVVNFIGKNHLSKTTAVASRDLKRFGATAKSVSSGINKSLGAIGVGVGLVALTNGLKNSVLGFEQSQLASKKLATVLANMGVPQATKRVDDYAESLERVIGVDAEEIKLIQTKLATYSALSSSLNVAGGAFDRATQAAFDMATVSGTAESNAEALGKALEDPIKGLASLTKNGYTFTAQEKAKIKTLVESNKILEAQEIILDSIEGQVKGTAEASASSFTKLQLIFDSIADQIGEQLLPVVEEFYAYLTSVEGQRNLQTLVNLFVGMAKVVSGIASFMLQNINLVIGLGAEVLIVKGYFVALNLIIKLTESGIIKATTAIKLMKIALISSGIGAALVLVGSLAAAWVEATDAREEYESVPPGTTHGQGRFQGPGIDPLTGTSWIELGFDSWEEWQADLEAKKNTAVQAAKDLADSVRKALDAKVEGMKKVAEKFRDAVGISYGLFGEDEYSVFNVDYFKGKLQRMVAAAKGFAGNLKKILKTPNSQPLVDELIAMGPVEGNIAAKALLASGDLKEIVALKSSLYNTGAQAGATQATMGNATYEINITKAVISAADIIREIRTLEKKTGRKYLVG